MHDKPIHTGWLFCILWIAMFVLYFPAARAGFVTDFTGWLDQVKNHGFWEYINRTNFHVHSLYQFTQFNTYVLYKLFGINAWLWHLAFITLHVVNACLVYKLVCRLLADMGNTTTGMIPFAGSIFFCLSPYISEVVVWEPAFHFLQGLLMILLILLWVQRYIHTGATKYAVWSWLVYFLSTFALELFYVTPWLVFTLAFFYRLNPAFDKKIFAKVVLWIFLPLLVLFVLRLVTFRIAYGGWVSRIGSDTVSGMSLASLGKPAKYVFHLLFLGRFLSDDIRHAVYDFCDSAKGLILFYGVLIFTCGYIAVRFRELHDKGKTACLLFVWTLIALALLMPLWFSDMMLVIFDRYTYLTSPFFYMLVAVLLGCVPVGYVRIGLIAVYAIINLRFSIKVGRYWGKSYRVDQALLTNIPEAGTKTIVLLNLPESMHGIPMIGSETESEYRLMHNLLIPDKKIASPVYDVLSYNMLTPDDGAHVTVVNDSTIRVTLNQWGTWWWFAGKGGYSYETSDYKLNLIDGGHFYELILKKPAEEYLLLYQVADRWKITDMNKRDGDQN